MATLSSPISLQHMGPPHQTWLARPWRRQQNPRVRKGNPLQKPSHKDQPKRKFIGVGGRTPVNLPHHPRVQHQPPGKMVSIQNPLHDPQLTSCDSLSCQGSIDPNYHGGDALSQEIINYLNSNDWSRHQIWSRVVAMCQVRFPFIVPLGKLTLMFLSPPRDGSPNSLIHLRE
jgi:hypothetical protein